MLSKVDTLLFAITVDETLCEVERSEVIQCVLDRVDQSTCVEQEQCVLQCTSQSLLPLVVY